MSDANKQEAYVRAGAGICDKSLYSPPKSVLSVKLLLAKIKSFYTHVSISIQTQTLISPPMYELQWVYTQNLNL